VSKIFKTAEATLLLLAMFSAPAIAHKVQVSGDVAGTWHVNPRDNPRAGESTKVWIALTRKGGEVLPLEQASCKLAVYSQPYTKGDQPILQPELKAIVAEKYQGIPGADVVFPAPGLYEMELSCTPNQTGEFEAFEMQSEITVASGAGQAPGASPAVSSAVEKDMATMSDEDMAMMNHEGQAQTNWGGIGVGVAIAAVIGFGVWKVLENRSMKK
jgi:hypothetical protein